MTYRMPSPIQKGSGMPGLIRTGESRDGVMFKKGPIDAWLKTRPMLIGPIVGWSSRGEPHEVGKGAIADMTDEVERASNELGSAYESFNAQRAKFNSEIRNEISSVSSSTRKIVAEFDKIKAAIDSVKTLMIGTEMAAAIVNAERLAVALEALSAIDSHSLTFAVIEKSRIAETSRK